MLSINLGCGSLAIEDWENLDNDSSLIDWFTLHKPELLPFFKVHDVSKGLPYDDESVDRIYLSNLIEHLEPTECRRLLKECLRVIKYDGKVRILVPDLDIILKHYIEYTMSIFNDGQPEIFKNALPSEKLAYIIFGNLYNSDPNYPKDGTYLGHKMIYNFKSLYHLLSDIGFKVIYNSNTFNDIINVEKKHLPMWYMLTIEAKKPKGEQNEN